MPGELPVPPLPQGSGVQRLGEAADHPDPEAGLALFVRACCALWA